MSARVEGGQYIHLEMVIDAAPDVMSYRLDLFRQLKDAHAEEDLRLLSDGEGVRVHECAPYALQSSKHGGQVIKTPWYVAPTVSILHRRSPSYDTYP